MNSVFSNGPSKDFVVNPFTDLMHKSTQLCIAAPYVTETTALLSAAKSGVSVRLLVGLNASTSPKALSEVFELPNLAIRYLTRRFHAKIYISDTAALVGSSNLTDGGLRSNREATIRLKQPNDFDAIEELRLLFNELWESAQVLTTDKMKRFTQAHNQFKQSWTRPGRAH
jgi:HKD family nuclease